MAREAGEWWRSEVARTAFKWERRAAEAGMGGDVSGFVAEVEAKLRDWVDAAEVRLRIDEPGLIAALKSTRLLPLAATGTSGSGVTDAGTRAADELRIFGIDLDALASERPIYGYLEGSAEGGPVASFGPIVLGFKDSVRARATFVLGDTRDSTLLKPVFAPVSLLEPSITAVSNVRDGLLGARSLAEACDNGYAEVQIHCGLASSEIARVVYTRGMRPSEAALPWFNAARLASHWVPGDDPGPSPSP